MAIIRRANCLKRRSGKSVEKKVKKVSQLILTFSNKELGETKTLTKKKKFDKLEK